MREDYQQNTKKVKGKYQERSEKVLREYWETGKVYYFKSKVIDFLDPILIVKLCHTRAECPSLQQPSKVDFSYNV